MPIVTGFNVAKDMYFSTTFSLTNAMLLGFTIGLSFYFWYFDVINPGLKCVYPSTSPQAIVPGIAVIVSLFGLFMAVYQLFWFMLVLSIVYVLKAAWHRTTISNVVGENNKACLHLAILSDSVTAVILGVYWFVVLTLSRVGLNISQGFWFVCVVIALEIHYQLLKKWVERLLNQRIATQTTPSVQT